MTTERSPIELQRATSPRSASSQAACRQRPKMCHTRRKIPPAAPNAEGRLSRRAAPSSSRACVHAMEEYFGAFTSMYAYSSRAVAIVMRISGWLERRHEVTPLASPPHAVVRRRYAQASPTSVAHRARGLDSGGVQRGPELRRSRFDR